MGKIYHDDIPEGGSLASDPMASAEVLDRLSGRRLTRFFHSHTEHGTRSTEHGTSHVPTRTRLVPPVETMPIHVPDIHEPTKPNPGLVAIMNARVREEALSSMMKHVRDQAGMMNRIHWEERTEQAEDALANADGRSGVARPNQRAGQGVRDSLTECPEALETRFVRCALSDVVEEIRTEDANRKVLIEQKREGARVRCQEAARKAETARAEADAERVRRRSYAVKSMDKLGGAAFEGGSDGGSEGGSEGGSQGGSQGGAKRSGGLATRHAGSRSSTAGDHFLAMAAARRSPSDAH